jgi:hypothetical protein
MVTKGTPERLPGLATAITCFAQQTYAPLELVIVVDPRDPGAHDRVTTLVAAMNASGVRTLRGDDGMSLGALRNLSMRLSNGSFFCQWDDDDLHHPRRVATQLAALAASDAGGVLLQDVLHFYPLTRQLWWTNWHATQVRGHPGTLLGRRDCGICYPESGQDAQRGEDTVVACQLSARRALTTLGAQPFLYVYVSHGQNTFDSAHHQMLSARLGVSRGRISRYESQLRCELAAFGSLLSGAAVVAPNTQLPVFRLPTSE